MAIIEKIKSFFAAKSIQKAAERPRLTHYPDFQNLRTVLVLFKSDESEENKFARSMAASLKEMGKKVSLWGYADKKEIATPIMPDFRLFGNKELSFFGVPSSELKAEFLLTNYDMVIQLSVADLVPLDYLLAVSKSPFKVSKTKYYKGIADFMIELDRKQDEKFLFDQILFYLKSIQAKS